MPLFPVLCLSSAAILSIIEILRHPSKPSVAANADPAPWIVQPVECALANLSRRFAPSYHDERAATLSELLRHCSLAAIVPSSTATTPFAPFPTPLQMPLGYPPTPRHCPSPTIALSIRSLVAMLARSMFAAITSALATAAALSPRTSSTTS